MGIYKGETSLSNLNLGGTTIQNVYKGTSLVWKSEPPIVDLELQAPLEYFYPDQPITAHGDFYVCLTNDYNVEVYDNYSGNTYVYYWNPTGDEAEVVGAVIYWEANDGTSCAASLDVGIPLYVETSLTVAIVASVNYIEHLIDVRGGIKPGTNEQYFNPSTLVTHRTLTLSLSQNGDIDVGDDESGIVYTFARNGSSGTTVDAVYVDFEDSSGYPQSIQLQIGTSLRIWSGNTVKFTAYTTYTPPLTRIASNLSTGDKVEWDEQNGLLYFSFSRLPVYDLVTWTQKSYSGTICIEDTNYNIPSLYELGQYAGERFTPGVITQQLLAQLSMAGDKAYYLPGKSSTAIASCGDPQADPTLIIDQYNNPGIYDKWDSKTVADYGLTLEDLTILSAMFENPNGREFADGTPFYQVQGAMGIFSNASCNCLRSIDYHGNQLPANCDWDSYQIGGFIPADFTYLQSQYILCFESDESRTRITPVSYDMGSMPYNGRFYGGKIRLKDLTHTNYSQDS